jgi:hypothetical protein
MRAPVEIRADQETHRRLAVDLFNHTWTFIERADRTLADDDEMVHAAHASRFHWGRAGVAKNWAVGEWQIARVYTLLGRTEPALHHARRCLAICEEHGVGDYAYAYAHEALARACAAARDWDGAARHLEAARAARSGIEEPEDQELLDTDLATIVLPGR